MKKIFKVIASVILLPLLGSCSFNEIPSFARAMFTMPDLHPNERPLAPFACLNVWGPDGRWNSKIKAMSRGDRALSVEFEVPYLWVGRQYTFRILGFNSDPSSGSANYTCPISSSSSEFSELGILENKLITKEITQVIISAHGGFSASDLCGTSLTKSCYDATFVAEHPNSATLWDGTKIERVVTAGTMTTGFKAWKKLDGGQLLKASGRFTVKDDWQVKLVPSGRGHTTAEDYFTSTSLIDDRVCPASVYLDDNHKTEGDCLYYSKQGTAELFPTTLSNNAVKYVDYIEDWAGGDSGNGSQPSYYEGNIFKCNQFGMRLPTLYEFNISASPGSSLLPTDAPGAIFGSVNGIPSETNRSYLTATAPRSNPTPAIDIFYTLDNNSGTTSAVHASSSTTHDLICVLP